MSENDVKQIDFNEDTLNILYDTAVAIRKENHNNPDSALGNLIRQYGPFMKEKEAEKAKEAQ